MRHFNMEIYKFYGQGALPLDNTREGAPFPTPNSLGAAGASTLPPSVLHSRSARLPPPCGRPGPITTHKL